MMLIGILSSVGGFEFACIVGVILGAAANHGLVIIDGFNTSACALVAKTLAAKSDGLCDGFTFIC